MTYGRSGNLTIGFNHRHCPIHADEDDAIISAKTGRLRDSPASSEICFKLLMLCRSANIQRGLIKIRLCVIASHVVPSLSIIHNSKMGNRSQPKNDLSVKYLLAEAVRFELTTPVVTGIPSFQPGALSHSATLP